MSKNITVVVKDPHSIGLYDVDTGAYLGIIYVTSGAIVGTPIVTHPNVTVTSQEGGAMYMTTYDMATKALIRKLNV